MKRRSPTHHAPRTPRRRVIVFLGPQGSGKGTQAALVAKRLRIPVVSTGVLYREEVESKTRLGRLARRYITRGLLVPDEITNALVAWRLKERDVKRGMILDGYPRTLAQMEAMDLLVPPTKAIVITVPDKVAIGRMTGRRVCSKCDENFHLEFRPPKKTGVCDECGGRLIRRPDDNPTAVKRRLSIYHKNTEPLLAVYDKRGILAEIDGTRSVDKVAAAVGKALEKRSGARSA